MKRNRLLSQKVSGEANSMRGDHVTSCPAFLDVQGVHTHSVAEDECPALIFLINPVSLKANGRSMPTPREADCILTGDTAGEVAEPNGVDANDFLR